MWTADNTFVTADSTKATADGGLSGISLPATSQSSRPDFIESSRAVSGQKVGALLLVLSATPYTGSTDVHASQRQFFEEKQQVYTEWKGSPLLTTLTAYPNDVVQGWDTEKWEVEPFIQQQKNALITVLQSYAAYNPATDVVGKPRTKPYFAEPEFFIQAQIGRPLNLQVNPPPVGDLTTFYRPKIFFQEPDTFVQENKGTWQIVLESLGPLPPPPPPPPIPVWPLPSTITNLPVRGAWEIPGGTQAIWVIGSGCFLMTVVNQPTANTQATFTLARVGTLHTSTNPVCIRDNGAGGAVVIVDGKYGYYYIFANAGGKVGSFYQITDPNFLGADRVAFIDGWWIFNVPGTQEFYTPTSTYSLTFNGTNFALKDGATDLLVTLYENKEELWLIGERTTEVWYDAGGQFFAFQRLVSTMLQVGCSAKNSIARFSSGTEDGLVWLARSERGQNVVVKTSGFSAEVISTPAINDAIASYTIVSDAIGYTYQEDGHEFYVLTFPSAENEYGGMGATWVYDGSTELWHQRLAYEPYAGLWYRHRSNCFLNFQNQRLVGDFQNGSIYRMDRSVYTDNGWPLVAWRRAPHIWDGGARERVFMAMLQIEFKPGTGNQMGLGYDPQAVLTISRDGGTTWGQELRRSIGRVGNYLTRTIWRRLSFARDAVVDVKVYDPVNRDIVGATLKKSDSA